jgi:hypothetical protein
LEKVNTIKEFLKATNLERSEDVVDYFKHLEKLRQKMLPDTPLPSQELVHQFESRSKYSGDVKSQKQPAESPKDFDPSFKYEWNFGESKELECFVYSVLPKDRNEWTKWACPRCFCHDLQTCDCHLTRVQTSLVAIHLISHLESRWTLKVMISGEDAIRIFSKLRPEILQSYENDRQRHELVITKYHSSPGSPEPHVFLCQDILS